MKVLMISGDKRIFEPGTEAHARLLLQRSQVEQLDAVVWGPGNSFSLFSILAGARHARYDVITAQDPLWRGLLAWVAARLSGARVQVQAHGDLSALGGVSRVLSHVVLRHADSVRVVSDKIKAQVIESGTRARIDVLPVYVDLDAVRTATPADLKQQYPNFTKIILVVSRLEPEKNVGAALEVLAEVVRTLPGTGVLLAGSGSREAELKRQARNLGVSEQVVFLGYRDDLASLYKGADLLLVTSLHESWGAAMVEALAAGCPVVAPDVGIAAEAGAIIKVRSDLALGVVDALKSGTRGRLQLNLLSKEEWARRWKETLS